MSSRLIGQTLLNQFRVEEFIASGGMGAVYRVWDLKRNVPLAMKVLHSELADDPAMFERFQREANALKKLAHPNIVPFYGLFQTDEFGFMLERFIDGPTLQSILKMRKGPLPVDEALVYLKGLCAALGYAHANGVVHCDVKPGNVMVDLGGSIYLTDFGIVRHSESTTTTMGTAGTPAYMAPEQIRGESVSPATDIYSLGVLLYEMLTGQRPFRGNESGTEKGGATANERIRYGHLNLQPPDPRTFNPNLSAELVNVILKALAKHPRDRYVSTLDFFNAVSLQAGRMAGQVPDHVSLPDFFTPVESMGEQEGILGNQSVQTYWRRSPWIWVGGAIGALVVCLLVIGAITLLSKQLSSHPNVVPTLPALVIVTQASIGTKVPIATQSSGPTLTPVATQAPAVTQLPVTSLDIGSERISPADQIVQFYIPAGKFQMGSNTSGYADEGPEHIVDLNAFWIDKTEVTNAMFATFASQTNYIGELEKQNTVYLFSNNTWINMAGAGWRNPLGPDSSLSGRENYPVIQVTWNDAVAYCNWAGRRLPTEAEWEKAARGINGNQYPWGDSAPSSALANYENNLGDTVAVGSYPDASPYGALDMAGNVYEWVADWYSKNYYSASPPFNPTGPSSGSAKVMRGGSWQLDSSRLHTYEREVSSPDYGNDNLGFRCAQDANP